LGLELERNDLKHVFTVTQDRITEAHQINKEFNDVYLIRKDIDLDTLTLQEEEVAEVKYMPWQEVRKHIEDQDPSFCQHEEEYEKLFEYLARSSS
jgi:isopentenyldiphosphate isomerase